MRRTTLQVYIGTEWGTVCNHGWKEEMAAVACQQMGYVLNPEDWFIEYGSMPPEGQDARILLR